MIEFKEWPKIPRLNRGVTITEKIDGTNACVVIDEDGFVGAQSRSKLITPTEDNYGFAQWVREHAEELGRLGPGHHYGEWWGQGIQRRYGLGVKRFSLFNVGRWADVHGTNESFGYSDKQQFAPACCYVVPILSKKRVDLAIVEAEDWLRCIGSRAVIGWGKPEGYIMYMEGVYTKYLLENSDVPKSRVAA